MMKIIVFLILALPSFLTHANTCIDRMDQFCTRLEDANHKGNSSYLKIYKGSYPGTIVPYASFIDAQAIVKSFDLFPEKLKVASFDNIKKLKSLLEYPLSTQSYSRKFILLSKQINQLTTSMKYTDLVTKFKYEYHPNWSAIKKSFLLAKENVSKVFVDSKISSEHKKLILNRIKNTRIIYPMQFENSKRVKKIIDTKCNQDMVNLFYLYDLNSVMVCSGYFNTYQNTHANVFLLAHEVAHSVDPRSLALSSYKESIVGKMFSELRDYNHQKSCTSWKEEKVKIILSRNKQSDYTNPYKKLLSCVGTKYLGKKLKNEDTLQIANVLYQNESKKLRKNIFSNDKAFLTAIKSASNERLDKSYTLKFSGTNKKIFNDQFDLAYIIKKEMDCGMPYKTALKSAKILYISSKLKKMDYCKEECLAFSDNEKSKESVEIFSDLIAQKAMIHFLKKLPSKFNKLEIMQSSLAMFCPKKNSVKDYVHSINFLLFEQTPNRNYLKTKNRLKMPFTQEVSKILQCRYRKIKDNPFRCNL